MFGSKDATPQASWKRVDDDFVLGACSRRLFGYLSRDAEGVWTAFDDDARSVAVSPDLPEAKAALWDDHGSVHAGECEPPVGKWWHRPIRGARERLLVTSR